MADNDKGNIPLAQSRPRGRCAPMPADRRSRRTRRAARSAADLEAVFDVPVQVSAVLGRARMDVGELLNLAPGAVLELDRRVGEAIDIYVNNRLVARGEVVLVEEKLGVTMTEIIKADRCELMRVAPATSRPSRRERREAGGRKPCKGGNDMRLLIVGTLRGQLTAATKIAMDKARPSPMRSASRPPWRCCGPARAPTS